MRADISGQSRNNHRYGSHAYLPIQQQPLMQDPFTKHTKPPRNLQSVMQSHDQSQLTSAHTQQRSLSPSARIKANLNQNKPSYAQQNATMKKLANYTPMIKHQKSRKHFDSIGESEGTYSYIDPPPIPWRKRYIADLRNQSASTEILPKMTPTGYRNRPPRNFNTSQKAAQGSSFKHNNQNPMQSSILLQQQIERDQNQYARHSRQESHNSPEQRNHIGDEAQTTNRTVTRNEAQQRQVYHKTDKKERHLLPGIGGSQDRRAIPREDSLAAHSESKKFSDSQYRTSVVTLPGNIHQHKSRQQAFTAGGTPVSLNKYASASSPLNGMRTGGAASTVFDDEYDQAALDMAANNDAFANNSFKDTCMQIGVQALSKSYDIQPNLAFKIIQDTKTAVNHFRKKVDMTAAQLNQRVVLGPNESPALYETLYVKFFQRYQQILEWKCDLRPVFNLILLGMQAYQPDRTKMHALNCLLNICNIENGKLRSKIWMQFKYTTIKEQAVQDTSSLANRSIKLNKNKTAKSTMLGYFQAFEGLMNHNDQQLASHAAYVMLEICQSNLIELFLSQISSLFHERDKYLQSLQEHFHMLYEAINKIYDDVQETPLLETFFKLGIPNFIVAQCLCLIEGNLIYYEEHFAMQTYEGQAEHSSMLVKIDNQNLLALSFLIELWLTFPSLFSAPQKQKLLELDHESDDFGLQEKLDRLPFTSQIGAHAGGQDLNKSLGSKVLSIVKRICERTHSDALKVCLTSKLFFLLESMIDNSKSEQMNNSREYEFYEKVFKLLVYLLIEWHHQSASSLRKHMLDNLTEVLRQPGGSKNIDGLVEPLCQVLAHNLEQMDGDTQAIMSYLNMDDFTFFWDCAHLMGLTKKSALAICKVVQFYMLKAEIPYKQVAEKIFYKLVSKFRSEDDTQMMLRQHTNLAMDQLVSVESQIQHRNGEHGESLNDFQSSKYHQPSGATLLTNQMDLHYFFRHLMRIGRGQKTGPLDQTVHSDCQIVHGNQQFSFLREHMISQLNKQLASRHSPILTSLLKKLMQDSQHGFSIDGLQSHSPFNSFKSQQQLLQTATGTPKHSQLPVFTGPPDSANLPLGLSIKKSHETILNNNEVAADAQSESEMARMNLLDRVMNAKESQPLTSAIQINDLDSQQDVQTVNRLKSSTDQLTSDSGCTIIGAQSLMNQVYAKQQEKQNRAVGIDEESKKSSQQNMLASPDTVKGQPVHNPWRDNSPSHGSMMSPETKLQQQASSLQTPKRQLQSAITSEKKEIGTDYDPPLRDASTDCQIVNQHDEKPLTDDIPRAAKEVCSIETQTTARLNNMKHQTTSSSDLLMRLTGTISTRNDEKGNTLTRNTFLIDTTSVPDSVMKLNEYKEKNMDKVAVPIKSDQQQSQSPTTVQSVEARSSLPAQKVSLNSIKETDEDAEQQQTEQRLKSVSADDPAESVDNNTTTALAKTGRGRVISDEGDVLQGSGRSQNSFQAKSIIDSQTDAQELQLQRTSINPQRAGDNLSRMKPLKRKSMGLSLRYNEKDLKSKEDAENASTRAKNYEATSARQSNATTLRTEIFSDEDYDNEQQQVKPLEEEREAEPIKLIQANVATPDRTHTPAKPRVDVSLDQKSSNDDLPQRPKRICSFCDTNKRAGYTTHTSEECKFQSQTSLPKPRLSQSPDQTNFNYKVNKAQPRAMLTSFNLPSISSQGTNEPTEGSSVRNDSRAGKDSKEKKKIAVNSPNRKMSSHTKSGQDENFSRIQNEEPPQKMPYKYKVNNAPIAISSTNDFWRNKKDQAMQSSMNSQNQPNMQMSNSRFHFQRMPTMSQQDDEEMMKQFRRQNQIMAMKQRLMVNRAMVMNRSLSNSQSIHRDNKMPIRHVMTSINPHQRDIIPQPPPQEELKEFHNTVVKKQNESNKQLNRLQTMVSNLLEGMAAASQDKSLKIPTLRIDETEKDNLSSLDQDRDLTTPGNKDKHKTSEGDNKTSSTSRQGLSDMSTKRSALLDDIVELDEEHLESQPGMQNLSPLEQAELLKLLQLKKSDEMLTPEQAKRLSELHTKWKNGLPLDENHPGFVNLSPEEQAEFKRLTKIQKEQLTQADMVRLNGLLNQIAHGQPYEEPSQMSEDEYNIAASSEGAAETERPVQKFMINGQELTPFHTDLDRITLRQREELFRIQEISEDKRTTDEKCLFRKCVDLIKNGHALNLSHPGLQNLTFAQRNHLDTILKQKSSGESHNQETLQNLQNLLQLGTPLNDDANYHQYFSDEDKIQFKKMQQHLSRGGKLRPKDMRQYEKLLTKLQYLEPLHLNYHGLANLRPEEKSRFRDLWKQKQAEKEPLTTDESKELLDLKNRMWPYQVYARTSAFIDHLTLHEMQKISAGGDNQFQEHEKACEKLRMPVSLSSAHPGIQHLTPWEKETFLTILKKRAFEDKLSPAENSQLDILISFMLKVRPLNQDHPGFEVLNRYQSFRFKKLTALKATNKLLTRAEEQELEFITDLIQNGHRVDAEHPGFEDLTPAQQGTFTDLYSGQKYNEVLSPESLKNLEQLKQLMNPTFFTQQHKDCLDKLIQSNKSKGYLDFYEEQQFDRLNKLKANLPLEDPKDLLYHRLSPEQLEQYNQLLATKLLTGQLSPLQQQRLNELVKLNMPPERNLTEEEQFSLQRRVDELYKGSNLSAKDIQKVDELHAKQFKDLGALTPKQESLLDQIVDLESQRMSFNDHIVANKDFLKNLQACNDMLSPAQEKELSFLDRKVSEGETLSPEDQSRLKNLLRIKFNKQLMTPEEQAMLHLMKELESKENKSAQDELLLAQLQQKFGCEPYLSHDDERQIGQLLLQRELGQPPLTEQEVMKLDRLMKMPRTEPLKVRSGLTAEEQMMLDALLEMQREYPERFQRYKDILNPLKEKAGLTVKENKSIIKSPDQKYSTTGVKIRKQVTIAPDQVNSNTMSSSPTRNNDDHNFDSMGPGLSPSLDPVDMQAYQQQKNMFHANVANHENIPIEELVCEYYKAEQKVLIHKYKQFLWSQFMKCKNRQIGGNPNGKNTGLIKLQLKYFLNYAGEKGIRYKEDQLRALMKGSDSQDISHEMFVKLFILGSCGGEKRKIGDTNFVNLLDHVQGKRKSIKETPKSAIRQVTSRSSLNLATKTSFSHQK